MVDECLGQETCKCEFDLDMDGQVTCVMCGARDTLTPPSWGDTPVSFEEQNRYMKLFGLEIRRDEQTKDITVVTCYKCARDYMIAKEHLRAYNYCPSCK